MKDRIKYDLHRYGKTVVLYVHKMDERFRSTGDKKVFVAENGIAVVSHLNVGLYEKEIVLVGKFIEDNDRFFDALFFNTEAEAIEYMQRANEAIEDWANNWEGWGEEPESAKTMTLYFVEARGAKCSKCAFNVGTNCVATVNDFLGDKVCTGYWTDRKPASRKARKNEDGSVSI